MTAAARLMHKHEVWLSFTYESNKYECLHLRFKCGRAMKCNG